MKNLRMFEVKYVPATNTKGSRIKITDTRRKVSVTISYDSAGGQAYEQAYNYLQDRNIAILYHGWDERTGHSFLMSEDFERDMKS